MEDSFTKVGVISGLFCKVSKNDFYFFHKMNIEYRSRYGHEKTILHYSKNCADFVDENKFSRFSSSRFNP